MDPCRSIVALKFVEKIGIVAFAQITLWNSLDFDAQETVWESSIAYN